jgi:intracellular septation protein A
VRLAFGLLSEHSVSHCSNPLVDQNGRSRPAGGECEGGRASDYVPGIVEPQESRQPSTRAVLGAGKHGAGMAHTLHMPSPRAFVAHALPAVAEGIVGPAVLFYLVLVTAGFRGALIAALVWLYLAAARRWVRRERIPASLLLGVVLLTARTGVAYATGSALLYFVQPTATTFLVGAVFLVTAVARRPLIERLAHDFCPIEPEVFEQPFLRRFFLRLSLLWAMVLFANAGTVLYLLLESSIRGFVVERTLVSTGLNVLGIAVSVLWFARTMRRAGVTVHWGRAPLAAASNAPD